MRATNWRTWPPRLPGQPIFYPVLNRDYAIPIAGDWNDVPRDGAGFVTRFEARTLFLHSYSIRQMGGRTIVEYQNPGEDLPEVDDNIVGEIEVTDEFGSATSGGWPSAAGGGC